MTQALLDAIRRENLDGWLFSNFHHRDKLSDSLLGLSDSSVNSRRWFYALAADASAFKIVHAIESSALDSLPGTTQCYSSLEGLKEILSRRLGGKRWACQVSPALPVISTMDAGTWQLLLSCGVICQGAESLIQRVRGILDHGGIESHRHSADKLGSIMMASWAFIRSAFHQGWPLREAHIQDFILDSMRAAGLQTDHPPIVATGPASADPHYELKGEGRELGLGDIIQLDMWAKGPAESDIYADISWLGVYAQQVPEAMAKVAQDVFSARDRALDYIRRKLGSSQAIRGCDVDQETRSFLIGRGYEEGLRHRTGHGIDRECHGSGVNLDCVEFPDERFILEGSCFSIEPGIYLRDFGMRTEIDVYIEGATARVSGLEPQHSLFSCG